MGGLTAAELAQILWSQVRRAGRGGPGCRARVVPARHGATLLMSLGSCALPLSPVWESGRQAGGDCAGARAAAPPSAPLSSPVPSRLPCPHLSFPPLQPSCPADTRPARLPRPARLQLEQCLDAPRPNIPAVSEPLRAIAEQVEHEMDNCEVRTAAGCGILPQGAAGRDPLAWDAGEFFLPQEVGNVCFCALGCSFSNRMLEVLFCSSMWQMFFSP